jgi:type III secretory pathway component EscT
VGSIAEGDMVQGLALALALGAARSVPIVLLVPGFGGRALPLSLRVAIGLLLASFSLPHLTSGAVATLLRAPSPAGWILLAAREALVGVTVGLVVSFFFRAAEAAGGLVDLLRGASFAEVLAPDSGARSSPTGALYLLLATVIFLELGGIGRLAVALARSYEALPLAGGVGAPAGLESHLQVVLAASAKLLESAVGLAAPAIVALLLADVALGVVGRVTPALPLYFAAMPLKGILSIGVVLLGLSALDAALVAAWPAWMALAARAFGLHSR